ncbi:MAG: DUF805 domain-containing protein [Pseudomonadota bacterium]
MLSATATELKKPLDFSGRTGRRPYLCFLTVSIVFYAVALALAFSLASERHALWVFLAVTAVFYIPVTSAGVRRLHDIGERGVLMLDPLKPAFAGLFLVWLLPLVTGGAFLATWIVGALLFPAAIIIVVFAALFGMTVATLVYLSNTMGLLLLPSEPGPNKYGPNPNEVSQ